MINKFYIALFVTAMPSAHGQVACARPDSLARAFYSEHAREYQKERAAMSSVKRRVARCYSVLQLRLSNSEITTFVDTIAEDDSHHRFVYGGYLPLQHLHVIEQWFYEGGLRIVIHDLTGQTEVLPGKPVVAPDARRFVAASMDLEAGYNPNRLEVWRVDDKRMRRELVLDGKDGWGPDSVIWQSRSVLSFVRTSLPRGTGEIQRVHRWLVRSGARWELRSRAP